MAQGTVKKAAKPAPTRTSKQQLRKGSRVMKPKASSNADKVQKKYAAGLTAKTEKLLGQRAGHLELIGQGKKAPKADKKPKGGSKKFG